MVKNVNAIAHPITNIDAIIIRWLDRGQKHILSQGGEKGWFWLRKRGFTLDTVADTQYYALSPLVDISKVITFYDVNTPKHIRNMTEQEFRRYEPGPDSTGTPYLYRVVDFWPVQNQPSSSSVLTMVSSDATDTAVDVNVVGLDGSGVRTSEAVTLNGTSSVTTVASYTRVLSLSKDAVSVGQVTITSNAAAVTNVVIPAKDRSISHPVIALFSIPDSVATLNYDFYMQLQDLTVGDDISMIPEKYHNVIEDFATEKVALSLNNPTLAQLMGQSVREKIAAMRAENIEPSGIWSLNSFEPRFYPRTPHFPGGRFPKEGDY
jgi:hypothetical protein